MTILWCCHIRGSDDVIPAPSYEEALKIADANNAIELLAKAVPAIWPWSAEAHAEYLAKASAAWDALKAAIAKAEQAS